MKRLTIRLAGAAISCAMCHPAWPQSANPPVQNQAAPAAQAPAVAGEVPLPDVEVIQKKEKPAPDPVAEPTPKVKKKVPAAAENVTPKPVAKKKYTPAPEPAPLPAGVDGSGVEGLNSQEGSNLAPGSAVRMSPLAGSELPLEKIPGSVSTVTANELSSQAYRNTTDALQSHVPGVIITDLQGNSYNQDVFYHGFQSSPVNGVPQGLAVYQNGVRINEVYSDVVEWDTIPSVAISELSVVSNNPAFGLNALGGALTLTMKDGFNYQGFEIDMRAGSYGHIEGSLQWGLRSGNAATYVAIEGIDDDGWRDFSPSTVKRMYADLGFKGDGTELHINFTGADNFLGLAGSTGIEAVNERYENVFTTPQTTANQLAMVSVNGQTKLNETLSLSGTAYFRSFKQKHEDGNITDLVACGPGSTNPGGFCFDEDDNTTNVPGAFDPNQFYGSIDRTSADAQSEGISLQAVEKMRLMGLGNQFMIGVSYDHGSVTTTASSELGTIPANFVVNPLGITIVDEEDSVKPLRLGTSTSYYGVYFSDSLDLTSQLTVTAGGRYNIAKLGIKDELGTSPDLNGDHTYERFNPQAGAAYKLLPGLSVYGGYSEANRAPTPAELACSDPNKPCLIESFLVADPELKQVVAKTWQAGIRGEGPASGGKLNWTLGLFRTHTDDEILNVAAAQQGRGYFLNAGEALRQGVDAELDYKGDKLSFYLNYSFVDATADSAYTLFAETNPSRTPLDPAEPDGPGTIDVRPGDRLPLVPRHSFKAGFDYSLTQKWKAGADVVMASNRFLLGDEANLNVPLPGYQFVNIHTSYDLTAKIQIYGLVNNVFSQEHFLFGTYFNPEDVKNRPNDSDPRSVMPGAPIAAYGGVRVKF